MDKQEYEGQKLGGIKFSFTQNITWQGKNKTKVKSVQVGYNFEQIVIAWKLSYFTKYRYQRENKRNKLRLRCARLRIA